MDIEEIAWAPRYGLKGIIDASVRTKIHSSNGGSSEKIMPLEFKTGKRTSGQVGIFPSKFQSPVIVRKLYIIWI